MVCQGQGVAAELGPLPNVSPAMTAVVIVLAGTSVVLTLTVPLGPYNPGIAVMLPLSDEDGEALVDDDEGCRVEFDKVANPTAGGEARYTE